MAMSRAVPFETSHEDMIHDAQLDYYGKKLATCSSDRTIKVFDVSQEATHAGSGLAGGGASSHQSGQAATLTGHTGPVWQVAWAHPKYGSILASCSYDGKVLIWKENVGPNANGKWSTIKEHSLHSASVNSVSWAPHELGAILACASSDGRVSVLTFKNDGTWDAQLFTAHSTGTNAVSWSPAVLPGSLVAPVTTTTGRTTAPDMYTAPPNSTALRFASAGCDNLIKIWAFQPSTSSWNLEDTLEGHTDWVRDVSWAPNIGLPRSYIASCSQDKTVLIWTKENTSAPWKKAALNPSGTTGDGKFSSVVWRVSWSLAGNILAVSCADGKVTLWKENLKGVWECASEMES